jgi:hypothetical protein
MAAATRATKSFSLEKDVLRQVEQTRGTSSTSERVNELLKVGLEAERRQSLHSEAAAFFSAAQEDPSERKAFQKAAFKSLSRDDD